MLDEGRLLGHEQRISGSVERALLLKRLPMLRTLSGPQLAFVADQIREGFFFLRKAPVFLNASISALGQLARGLTEVRMPPGTRLWHEGEATGWGSMIVSGSIRCTSSRGHDFVAGPGIPLGALDAVAELPRWFDAVTETPVVALQANMHYLIDEFEDNFALAIDYLAVQAPWQLEILDRSLASRDRLTRVYGCEPEAEALPAADPAAAIAGPA